MALIDNLESYWKLDEASGNALDAHGTNELAETSGTIASAGGKIVNARDFEAGDTEYFNIGDGASISTGDTDFTFACWVNAETLADFPVIAHKGWAGAAGANREWVLYYDTTASRFKFEINSDVVAANNFGAASVTTWYFIVVWHDAANNLIGISVDAGTADTTGTTAPCQDGNGPFEIGACASIPLYWGGLIDEAGFWRRVLTSGERTSLHGGGAGLAYPFSVGNRRRRLLLLRAG